MRLRRVATALVLTLILPVSAFAQEAEALVSEEDEADTLPAFDATLLNNALSIRAMYMGGFHYKNVLALSRGSFSQHAALSISQDWFLEDAPIGLGIEGGVGFYSQSTFYRYALNIQEFINTNTRFIRNFLTATFSLNLSIPAAYQLDIRLGAQLHFGWLFAGYTRVQDKDAPGQPQVAESLRNQFNYNLWPSLSAAARIYFDTSRKLFADLGLDLRFAVLAEQDTGTGLVPQADRASIYGFSAALGMQL